MITLFGVPHDVHNKLESELQVARWGNEQSLVRLGEAQGEVKAITSMLDTVSRELENAAHENRALQMELAQQHERSRQTADRFAEALARAERSEDFARKLTAKVVKMKMMGANMPAPDKPARVREAGLDDETILRRRSRQNFVDNLVNEAVKNGAKPEEARAEASRMYDETFDNAPPAPV
jgi:hypothetical protein